MTSLRSKLMKKHLSALIVTTGLLVSTASAQHFNGSSADQYQYSSSNQSGIRYADFFKPNDYQPQRTASSYVPPVYYPPAVSYGIAPKNKGKLWGYADPKGHWLIPAQWEAEGEFKDNPAARVSTNVSKAKSRIIDRSGKYISGEFDLLAGMGGTYMITGCYTVTVNGETKNREFLFNQETLDSILFPPGLVLEKRDLSIDKSERYRFILDEKTNKPVGIIQFPQLKVTTDILGKNDYVGSLTGRTYEIDKLKDGIVTINVMKDKQHGKVDVYGNEVEPLH